MQRESDATISGRPSFAVSVEQFDIDVLIERAGKAISGGWDDAPAPAILAGKRDGRIICRIAQAKQREFLERSIEYYSANRRAPTRSESHQAWKVSTMRRERQRRDAFGVMRRLNALLSVATDGMAAPTTADRALLLRPYANVIT